MTYLVYRLCAWLLFYTHEAIGYPLFGLVGTLAYYFAPRKRALVAQHMRIVMGEDASAQQVRRATREAFRHLAWNYYELFHMPAFTTEEIRRRLHIEGLDHLDAALELGNGAVLATLHFGNTETLIQVPLLFPRLKFVVPVEKMNDERVFQLMRRLRESQGMELVPVDMPLKLMRRLKQNYVIGAAADRDVTGSGIVIEFFGKPARLPDGPVRLALRTGAALMFGYGWRAARGNFHVRIMPPIALVNTGDAERDARTNLSTLLRQIECVIHERPGQWMAFHPLWIGDFAAANA
ncbi:MAG: lysophospholipid acyltransferase family protein [Chloroflexi bacterium]|nr:lysophospholipid acyltransferase family protein [Chloroflexota bacterium]